MRFLWARGMRSERNLTVAFASRGPARAAHGHVRVDRVQKVQRLPFPTTGERASANGGGA